ncbi:Type IV pilus biogenesis protein PilN [Thioalkalivibrio nitratireducens DSM 14787]|uniref:Type IV pilus biogenesis protein PilN n=1 Tax=Thioalkalivibrio nitratireducens (strain DSM 14787 / UNIQEM 213 / ALEN2) TaxID=1255043 RepID=L0E1I5_THIND|nr:PilN domain-containing protein [Thioalkalivibrio nitratireducens]AGA35107.1 Type IV pilus biogenesis protein PilN [Thioalkalivibrio nitratireducens DSM 14787]
MIYVNLLPWREKRRALRQKRFYALAGGAALVGILLVFAAHLYMNARIEHQQNRNQLLQSEIRTLDRQIARIRELDRQRQNLVDRIEVIQTLQASRPEAVHLFDELVLTLPEGTFYRELRQERSRLRMVGRAESNARISALMRRVDASSWLSDSTLQIIETRQEGRLQVRDFRLEATQTRPSADAEQGEGAS